eukprot:1912139-Amphidinium_carterae.1
MDASIDAGRLRSEREKKRTKTADPEFKKKRSEMESDEFANMFSNAAGSQRPTPKPKPAPGGPKPPPPKGPPPTGETYTAPKPKGPPPGAPGGPPPPPPKGEAASSSSSGVQFGAPPTKGSPPMRMRGADVTVTRPLSETIGVTWSGYYGDLLSDSTDVQTDFNKLLPERASRLSIFSNQDGYHIPERHPSST